MLTVPVFGFCENVAREKEINVIEQIILSIKKFWVANILISSRFYVSVFIISDSKINDRRRKFFFMTGKQVPNIVISPVGC